VNKKLGAWIFWTAFAVMLIIWTISVLFDVVNWWDFAIFNPTTVIIDAVGAIILCACFVCLIKKINLSKNIKKKVTIFSLVYLGVVGTTFICLINNSLSLTADTSVLYNVNHNASYLSLFPYMDFFALVIRIIRKIFGENNFLPFMFLNLVSISVIYYFVQKITDLIFKKNEVTITVAILLMLFLPLIFFISLIYGDIMALSCFVAGIFAFLKYINLNRKRYLIAAIFCLVSAVLLKGTFSVFILFLIVFGIIYAVQTRKIKFVILPVSIFILAIIAQNSFAMFYEWRYNLDNNSSQSTPMTSYIAMGLQSGWYGCEQLKTDCGDVDYTTSAKKLNGIPAGSWNWFSGNTDSSLALESINKSISSFLGSPEYFVSFFSKKLAYQWSDPSFFSRSYHHWENDELVGAVNPEWRYTFNSNSSPVIIELTSYDSATRKITDFIEGTWQFLVYTFAAIGFLFLARDKKLRTSPGLLLISTVIILGFGFYLIWEAMPRYALPFLPFMMIIAAYGITCLSEKHPLGKISKCFRMSLSKKLETKR
jgi:hypothetical protein